MNYAYSKDNIASATATWTLLSTFSIAIHNTVRPYGTEIFIALFTWRYLRLLVHMISFWLYKPVPVPENPTVTRSDVTVIVPIVDPKLDDPQFDDCLLTVLANDPAEVIVSTVGKKNLAICQTIIDALNATNKDKVHVVQQSQGNKRRQVCHAIPHVKTDIVVTVDATAFWPSDRFLPALLAPFEDPDVGIVGTYKRVVREPTGISFKSFWNFIGCIYLERHNFEVAATSNIDGGMFVISGRTAAYRTEIFKDAQFQQGFQNERFFFGWFGPLNPDDDNFITRWVVRRGWKIKFQYSKDATTATRVGTYPKYLSQCLRWVRTTWRSNSASLFTDPFRADCERTVYTLQPWCVYAVYLTSFTNFALFTDAALTYFVSLSSFADVYGLSFALKCMAGWIFASKLVKPIPHFRRNPADLIFLPGYILFGYYHSLLKLYALFTFWNCAWGSRVIEDAKPEESTDDNDDANDSEYLPSPTDTLDADDGFDFHGRSPRNTIGLSRRNVGARRGGSPATTNIIGTRWGAVKTASPHVTPVNVLEPQIPGFIGRFHGGAATSSKQVPSKSSASTSKSFFSSPKPKLYTWTRGSNCERLHSEGYNLMPVRSRCVLGGASGNSGARRP
jgi:cellulose synthase/poly-beta-1,6-N-acetylglucosamine synthase-like glycosyltransferase